MCIAILLARHSDVSRSFSRITLPRFNPVIQPIDLPLSVFTQIAASVVGEGIPASLSTPLPQNPPYIESTSLHFMETVQRLTELEGRVELALKDKQVGIMF